MYRVVNLNYCTNSHLHINFVLYYREWFSQDEETPSGDEPAKSMIHTSKYSTTLGNNLGDVLQPPNKEQSVITGTGSLIGRVNKLEQENIDLKKEMFEMEVHLLKALSDNKTYLVQKIKEFKAVLKASYGNVLCYGVLVSVFSTSRC